MPHFSDLFLGFPVLGNSPFLVLAAARMVILWPFVHGIVNELQIKSLLAARETGQNSLLGIGLPFFFDLMRANALPTLHDPHMVWQE